jgi:ferrochelatase
MNELITPSTFADSAQRAHKVGVLLVNLGTPDAADAASVRRYLKEFLSDPRVIENQGLLWKILLTVILLIRPRIKARAYQTIWNRERNESPLMTITRAQAEKLAAQSATNPSIAVDWAMRYGNPSMESRLDALAAKGCDRILVVPLYPQYAAATTATVADEAFRCLTRMRNQPAIRIAPAYYDQPTYIEALASSVTTALAALPIAPDVILASFHGIPEEYARKGDPYPQHCAVTTRLLRTKLGLDEAKLVMTFQSRFGRAKWLEPYTDATVKRLAASGAKNLVVITPGFSADCLETLEEISVENAEIFRHNGGENFTMIPCLNDSSGGMAVISSIVANELKGWI